MKQNKIHLLLIEDNPGDAFLIEEMASDCSNEQVFFRTTSVSSLAEAERVLASGRSFEAVVSDLGLPDSQGLETLASLYELAGSSPIVVLTGHADESTAIEALKAGAQDYLVKGKVDSFFFRRSLLHAIERKNIEDELKRRNLELETLYSLSTSISMSIEMDTLFADVLDNILLLDVFREEGKAAVYLFDDGAFSLAFCRGFTKSERRRLLIERADRSFFGFIEQSIDEVATKDEPVGRVSGRTYDDHVAIPLLAKQRLAGALYLRTGRKTELDDITVKMLLSLGHQLGMAVENAKLYEETKLLSLHDALTGLANRRLMDEMLKKEIESAERYRHGFCVVMADIDHFKRYNDTYGHRAGDEMLKQVAATIVGRVRRSDLAVRYGGEEFLVALSRIRADMAWEVAERIRVTVKNKLGITISLGIAEYRKGLDAQCLVEAADRALYEAKNTGRDCSVLADTSSKACKI